MAPLGSPFPGRRVDARTRLGLLFRAQPISRGGIHKRRQPEHRATAGSRRASFASSLCPGGPDGAQRPDDPEPLGCVVQAEADDQLARCSASRTTSVATPTADRADATKICRGRCKRRQRHLRARSAHPQRAAGRSDQYAESAAAHGLNASAARHRLRRSSSRGVRSPRLRAPRPRESRSRRRAMLRAAAQAR
jgi:hypothetical protein